MADSAPIYYNYEYEVTTTTVTSQFMNVTMTQSRKYHKLSELEITETEWDY